MEYDQTPAGRQTRKSYMTYLRRGCKVDPSAHITGSKMKRQWSKPLVEHFKWWSAGRKARSRVKEPHINWMAGQNHWSNISSGGMLSKTITGPAKKMSLSSSSSNNSIGGKRRRISSCGSNNIHTNVHSINMMDQCDDADDHGVDKLATKENDLTNRGGQCSKRRRVDSCAQGTTDLQPSLFQDIDISTPGCYFCNWRMNTNAIMVQWCIISTARALIYYR